VDLIDVSSGGNTPKQKINIGVHFQVPFAEEIKKNAGIKTGSVGFIKDPKPANGLVENGQVDLVFLARGFLADGNWVIRALKN